MQGGAGVRMTRQGWVGSGEDGPEVGPEGAGPERRDAESSWSEASGDEYVMEGYAGLTVEAGWGVLCLRTT